MMSIPKKTRYSRGNFELKNPEEESELSNDYLKNLDKGIELKKLVQQQ